MSESVEREGIYGSEVKPAHWRHKQLRFLRGYYTLVINDMADVAGPWLQTYQDRLDEINRELREDYGEG